MLFHSKGKLKFNVTVLVYNLKYKQKSIHRWKDNFEKEDNSEVYNISSGLSHDDFSQVRSNLFTKNSKSHFALNLMKNHHCFEKLQHLTLSESMKTLSHPNKLQ